ncbi:MAG TPA: lipid II flippase MurJ, partial [Rhodobacteraceae bacterium]|nr:lipid II flippase MurJ [Paracoccaceae bacterium]
ATAAAVAVYGAGLPAFVLQKVLQPLYFARADTRTPFRLAVVAMLVNAAAAIGLAFVAGYIAAAIGATLAGWAMVGLLWRGSRGMGAAAEADARLRRRLPRIVLASALMGAGLMLLAALLGPVWAMPGWRVAALALLIGAGIVLYFGAAQLLGALRLSELRTALRR